MDGVLAINKPSGMTSHDVVQAVRRMLREKRVGHTGTLDPLATGLLVLCMGKATRIARYLEAGEKEYTAVMRLGVITDTQDSDGRILETRTYTPPVREAIIGLMGRFTGSIMQEPPVFSAIKVSGVPSYKLARQGKAKSLAPRQVTIFSIDLLEYDDPFIRLSVRCSKGVYIRTLCADIGNALGMGAHLTGLVRTRSGRFRLDNAVTLESLSEAASSATVDSVLVSIDEALAEFPVATMDEAGAGKIVHGNSISWPETQPAARDALMRVHGPSGSLLAVARAVAGMLKPELVFAEQEKPQEQR
jgi:tRNA pseudouridine55 synthase